MNDLIINWDDIKKVVPISDSASDSVINPYISDAQMLDLLPLIGEKLLNVIIDDPADHVFLLEGGKYMYEGDAYRHPGVKNVLAKYFFARYMMTSGITDTPFGFVEKTHDGQSSTAPVRSKAFLAGEYRDSALKSWNTVAVYMRRVKYKGFGDECSRPAPFRRINFTAI